MLIIVYNCHFDWILYLRLSACRDPQGYCRCMHASKQASRSAVQVGSDLANRQRSNHETPKVPQKTSQRFFPDHTQFLFDT
jgi:hypothetical protein